VTHLEGGGRGLFEAGIPAFVGKDVRTQLKREDSP